MRTRTAEIYTFTVEGRGNFPTDMLRYDQCWPYQSLDAAAIDEPRERRRVVLQSCSATLPTSARWESYTWRVIGIGEQRPLPAAPARAESGGQS